MLDLRHKLQQMRGMTLIELLIGVAVISIVGFSMYRVFAGLIHAFAVSKTEIVATQAANEAIEIIRNMPYASVGTVGGIPSGLIPPTSMLTKSGLTFLATTTVRNLDDPFDGTIGGSPNDLSPADFKLVEIALMCLDCTDKRVFVVTNRIAPASLETSSTNGALFVQVIDANGQPVDGAVVNITNTTTNPQVSITDVTDDTGFLKIIDVPPATQSYHIVATKSGYSLDQTYVATPQNPNPIKPDATVALQTVTQVTLSIDRVATVYASSVSENCVPVENVAFSLIGAKLIGTNPNNYKFSQSYATNGAGLKTVSGLEWDTYTGAFSNTVYDVSGTIPPFPLTLTPNSSQNLKLTVKPKNPSALLVTVLDSASQLPLSDAQVTITLNPFSAVGTTGLGSLTQTDWSGGGGQDLLADPAKYFDQDGGIAITNPAGELKLATTASDAYADSGSLTSSTFDTGSAANFYTLSFEPTSQPPDTGAASIRLQLATATTTEPLEWTFVGPDGTPGTYFTASNENVSVVHNSDRYFRYRAYLSTASTTFTPNLADVQLTYASECVPSGQALFQGLSSGSYTVSVTKAGYQSSNAVADVFSQWQEKVMLITATP